MDNELERVAVPLTKAELELILLVLDESVIGENDGKQLEVKLRSYLPYFPHPKE